MGRCSAGWALHPGVVLSFALGVGVSPALAPAVTAVALVAAWWFGRRSGLATRHAIGAAAVIAAVLAGCLALAATFFDLTWDGQWYHQTAVYKMAEGWNPLRDPLHAFGRHTWNLWVLHYAKGPWYVALALFATTGNIEVAKAASAITPVIALLVVLAAALDLGLTRRCGDPRRAAHGAQPGDHLRDRHAPGGRHPRQPHGLRGGGRDLLPPAPERGSRPWSCSCPRPCA